VANTIKYTHVLRTVGSQFEAIKAVLPGLVATYNHGDIWIVGNEPDRVQEDNNYAETYADYYYQYATIIKTIDPTAIITFATMTSVTPTRLLLSG